MLATHLAKWLALKASRPGTDRFQPQKIVLVLIAASFG
jgi:hypothetical protein